VFIKSTRITVQFGLEMVTSKSKFMTLADAPYDYMLLDGFEGKCSSHFIGRR
jgi:hypothetical protein